MAFVLRAFAEPVPPAHPVYSIIAAAYGDEDNPGLPHVCPGVSRERLLMASAFALGFPDPASIYLDGLDGTNGTD